MLEIMRKGVVDLFNKSKDKTLKYIQSEVLRDISNRVDALTEDPTITLRDIADNFKTFEVPLPFQGPMPLNSNSAEQDIIDQEYRDLGSMSEAEKKVKEFMDRNS